MSNGYDGSKKYVLWFVDEYDNCYLVGFFDDLSDALPDVNSYLGQYQSDPDEEYEDESKYVTLSLGEGSPFGTLSETMGTLGAYVGREFVTKEGSVQVRGFVLR